MHIALNIEEYRELLDIEHFKHSGKFVEFPYMSVYLDEAKCWERQIHGINHLLSIVIEQYQKKNMDVSGVIPFVYNFDNFCNFSIQEGNLDFLNSLFSNDLKSGIELEEELIIAQIRISRG